MAHKLGINAKQLFILKLLYKFRFITPNLISIYKSLTISSVNQTLKVLVDRKLIDRHYSSSYRIGGKPAAYYLTSDGIKFLEGNVKLNESVVHSFYHNGRAGEPFIIKHLDIFITYIKLTTSYKGEFNIFTLSDSRSLTYLPEPRPDLYISRKQPNSMPSHYFLNILSDNRLFVAKKLIESYIEYFDGNSWKDEAYPTLLLVCQSPNLERGIQRYTENALPDFDVLTTSIKALLNTDDNKIWSDTLEPEVLTELV